MPLTRSPRAPRPPFRRRLRGWAIEAAVVLAIALGAHWWRTRDLPAGPAPALAGTLLDGRSVSLEALRGAPVLVHFWATWCGVCSVEAGTIDALAKDHRVLTVAVDSGAPADVSAHLAARALSFPTLVGAPALAREWGVRAFPTTFVLDANGRIRFTEVGWTSSIGLRARLWLAGR
jgi:thiol-disulfide isomerase/thioredoxin